MVQNPILPTALSKTRYPSGDFYDAEDWKDTKMEPPILDSDTPMV